MNLGRVDSRLMDNSEIQEGKKGEGTKFLSFSESPRVLVTGKGFIPKIFFEL